MHQAEIRVDIQRSEPYVLVTESAGFQFHKELILDNQIRYETPERCSIFVIDGNRMLLLKSDRSLAKSIN